MIPPPRITSYNVCYTKLLRVLKIDDYRKEELKLKMKYLKPDVFVALYTDEFVGELAKASKARIKVGPLSKWHSFLTYNKGVFRNNFV